MFDRLKVFLGPTGSTKRSDAWDACPATDVWRDGYDAGERSAPFEPPTLSADAKATWIDGYLIGQASWQAW